MAEKGGYSVLRLPPYRCILNRVRHLNMCISKSSKVVELIRKKNISAEKLD